MRSIHFSDSEIHYLEIPKVRMKVFGIGMIGQETQCAVETLHETNPDGRFFIDHCQKHLKQSGETFDRIGVLTRMVYRKKKKDASSGGTKWEFANCSDQSLNLMMEVAVEHLGLRRIYIFELEEHVKNVRKFRFSKKISMISIPFSRKGRLL